MAADVFRGAMQDDVGTEIKWPLIIRGEERVIDDCEQVVGFGKSANSLDAADFEQWIGERLEENRFGLRQNGCFNCR